MTKILVTTGNEFLIFIEALINQNEEDSIKKKFKLTKFEDINLFSTNLNVITFSLQPDKSSIGIEDLIKVKAFASRKPHLSNKSYIFIDNAEKITKEGQNSLLKILEEPPFYLEIILISKTLDSILETVRSRSLIYTLQDNSTESTTDQTIIEFKNIFLLKNLSEVGLWNFLRDLETKVSNLESFQKNIYLNKIINTLPTIASDLSVDYKLYLELNKLYLDLKTKLKNSLNTRILFDYLFVRISIMLNLH